MFNRLQMQEALKNPGITQQRLGQYQSPMSPNPQVRPDDAEAEEVRRAQRIQSAMGEQAAAMGDPAQTPSIMAKTMMENAQLKKMLAAMQQRQQPMQVPQARGLESLPAPAVEKGYAGGGIVAFSGEGPSLVRGASRMNISGQVPEDRSFFSESSPFSVGQKDEREILQEIEAKIAQGTATPSEIRRAQGIRARLLGNVAPAQPRAAVPVPSYEQDIAGPDFKFPLRPTPAEVKGSPAPARQGMASLRPSAPTPMPEGVDDISAGYDVSRAAPAGLLGAAQTMAAQEQGAVGPELTQEARLRQALAARRTLMQELGLSGGAGDELRAQAEEMKAAQAKYKEQAGLAGLANVLAAYGAAPRKRAAGAAGQAAAQFVSGQQDAERKFEMDMAALKASATRADRAEKRGDLDAVMKENQFQETIKAEMDRIRTQIESREKEGKEERALKEREGALDRQLKERMLNLEIKSRFDLESLSSKTKLQIANMAPDTLRVIDGIAQRGNMSFNEALDKFLTKGKSEVSAADRARLAAAFNDLPRSERDKYNGVEDFIAQMTGGAGGMPAGVTVKKKD
jgi:hypothetical protein